MRILVHGVGLSLSAGALLVEARQGHARKASRRACATRARASKRAGSREREECGYRERCKRLRERGLARGIAALVPVQVHCAERAAEVSPLLRALVQTMIDWRP